MLNRERLHLSRAKTLMSKMYADHLKRDFYEARVGITARLARVCCPASRSWPCRDWHMLLTSRTHSMHDDDTKFSLHATTMHIAVLLTITADKMEIARTLWLRAHAKSSKQQRLTDLERVLGPGLIKRLGLPLVGAWSRGARSICGAIASFSCGFKFRDALSA